MQKEHLNFVYLHFCAEHSNNFIYQGRNPTVMEVLIKYTRFYFKQYPHLHSLSLFLLEIHPLDSKFFPLMLICFSRELCQK